MPPKYAIERGVVWRSNPLPSGTVTENMVYELTFLAHEPRLITYGIRTPTFMPYEPNLWGMGVVFNIFILMNFWLLSPRVCKPWFPNRGSRLPAEQRLT